MIRRSAKQAIRSLRSARRGLAYARRIPNVGLRPLSIATRVRKEHLTYLSIDALLDLAEVARRADLTGLEGGIVETGTALGGSAIVLAAAKRTQRPLHVFDVFGQIPRPSDKDDADVHKRYQDIVEGQSKGLGQTTYYGYRSNLLDEVEQNFARLGVPIQENNVRLIPGLFEDTLQPNGPVAIAHLDGDWYESTMVCLQRLAPWIVLGGRFVIDDYADWSGCRKAVHDFLANRADFRIEQHARLHLVRVRPPEDSPGATAPAQA